MGRMSDLPARIPIDDGSEVNYIDKDFFQHNDIPAEDANHNGTMATKVYLKTKVTSQKIQLIMGDCTRLVQFACIP